MDVGRALLVGFDNDLVDQAYQLVVGGGGDIVATPDITGLALVHIGQQIADAAHVGQRTEELIDTLPEFAVGRHAIDNLPLGKDVGRNARGLDPLGIRRNNHDAFCRLLDR